MKISQQIRHIIFISAGCMLLFFSAPAFGQDSEFFHPDYLIASASIPSEQMSISYHGVVGGKRPVLSDTIFKHTQIYDTGADTTSLGVSKTRYERVEDKIKSLTRYVLRYLHFDQSDAQDSKALLKMETKVHSNAYSPDDMDISVSVNVGVDDETKDFAINALKVSYFGFSTYLDAVYDYRKDQMNLYLSNMYLNGLLLEGMKLEFQVYPKEKSGAVVLNMCF